MGQRVTEGGNSDLARASRLKRALESGAPPSLLYPEAPSVPGNGSSANKFEGLQAASESIDQQYTLNARLELLEQMSQASPDALCIADSNHVVLWVNETFVQMFGYAKSDILGQPLENLVVTHDRLA